MTKKSLRVRAEVSLSFEDFKCEVYVSLEAESGRGFFCRRSDWRSEMPRAFRSLLDCEAFLLKVLLLKNSQDVHWITGSSTSSQKIFSKTTVLNNIPLESLEKIVNKIAASAERVLPSVYFSFSRGILHCVFERESQEAELKTEEFLKELKKEFKTDLLSQKYGI